MSAAVAASVFAIAGTAGPFALAPRLAPLSFLIRGLAVWVLTALVLFFIDDQVAVLGLAAVILFAFTPFDPVQRVGFFLVAAPCLPAYLQFPVPFPGINWLVLLTYYKVVVIIALASLMFRLPSREGNGASISLADVCLALYLGLTVILVTGSMGLSAGPRYLIDQMILFVIPYLVLSRVVRTPGDLDFCFRAILLVSLILASIAIVATVKQWDFYRFKEPPSVFLAPDTRSGLIRISTTLNTHSLGYHLAIGVLVLEYLKKSLGLGFVRLWLFRLMLLAGIMFTDSRGTMLGLAVAFCVYSVIMIRRSGVRWALLISLALSVVGAGIWLITTDDASSVDAYNSVGYRQLLLYISVQHILEHPILGDLGFWNDPAFNVLRQGQGIIDITNYYLLIGLSFGLVALGILALMYASIMRRLLGFVTRPAKTGSAEDDDVRQMSAIVLSALIGWLLLIATTSDVALTFHLGLVLVALGRAITRFAAVQPAEQRAPETPLRTVRLHRPALTPAR